MNANEQIIESAKKLIIPFVHDFEQTFQAQVIWIKVFGSRVHNNYRETSDLDIAIYCTENAVLSIDQDEAFGKKWKPVLTRKIGCDVHLIVVQHDNVELLNNIEKENILIFPKHNLWRNIKNVQLER